MSIELQIANTMYHMYDHDYNEKIDEMKLHKLMYFAQREGIIRNRAPLFSEDFEGWKYGPVLLSVRKAYKNNVFDNMKDSPLEKNIKDIVKFVYDKYAEKPSWSLSRITHGEISWNNSRKGIADGKNGNEIMKKEDIYLDAERIRKRRKMRKELGTIIMQ